MLFECGEAAFFEPWQLNVARRGCRQQEQEGRARRARSKSKKAGESSGKKQKDS